MCWGCLHFVDELSGEARGARGERQHTGETNKTLSGTEDNREHHQQHHWCRYEVGSGFISPLAERLCKDGWWFVSSAAESSLAQCGREGKRKKKEEVRSGLINRSEVVSTWIWWKQRFSSKRIFLKTQRKHIVLKMRSASKTICSPKAWRTTAVSLTTTTKGSQTGEADTSALENSRQTGEADTSALEESRQTGKADTSALENSRQTGEADTSAPEESRTESVNKLRTWRLSQLEQLACKQLTQLPFFLAPRF